MLNNMLCNQLQAHTLHWIKAAYAGGANGNLVIGDRDTHKRNAKELHAITKSLKIARIGRFDNRF